MCFRNAYYYGEQYDYFLFLFCISDLDENLAFETETGDQLADWMSWRCNIGKLKKVCVFSKALDVEFFPTKQY